MSPLAVTMALAGPAAWFGLLAIARPELVADEVYHVPAVRALAQGDWGPVGALPMPPTYHLLAALPVRVLGGELWVIRGFNALLSGLTLIVFGKAAVRHDPHGATHRLLRLAWNPLLGPLWVLAYTDAAALFGVAFALAFYARKQHGWAAAGLLLACLVRQSNVLWPVLFAAWAVIECRDDRTAAARGRLRSLAATIGPYGLALVVAVICMAVTAFGQPPLVENRPRFNPAQFYLFGLTAALLAAPVWLPALAAPWRRWFGQAIRRPWICAAAIAAVGLLELTFGNPHPWNADPDYLRNWPLLAMTRHLSVRYLAAVVLVAFVPTAVYLAWRSPRRTGLAAVVGVSLVFLAGHYLVDPRYYIVPVVLLDFWSMPTRPQARRLTVWYVLLSAALAAFIGLRPGGYSGVA